jgi:RHS repeat-associated protein
VKFGAYIRDSTTALDYADQRYYASEYGRFNTPDPGNSANASNPNSLNMYAYTDGDPVNHNDTDGRCTRDADGDWWDADYGYELSIQYSWNSMNYEPGFAYYDPGSCLDDSVFMAEVNADGGAMLNGGTYYPPPIPVQPAPHPKCWQNVPNIGATLGNIGTDIETDVETDPNGKFDSADLQLLTADINSDIASEMAAIGGGTTAKPYYIGGHFNLTISAIQIAAFSAIDQQTFSSDFWGGTNDGTRQGASTGLALAGGYTLHSHGGVNSPYSFHFDRFNPQDLVGFVGHGVYDVLGGHLGHPCLDPAWH